MRRLIFIVLLVLISAVFASCSEKSINETGTAESTQSVSSVSLNGSQLHTIASPKSAADEYEWSTVDGNVEIIDAQGNPVISRDDISAFALVGSQDDDSYYEILLTDTGKGIMRSFSSSSSFDFTVDGEKLCSFIYEENGSETFEIGKDMTYDELCKAATKIRGLE